MECKCAIYFDVLPQVITTENKYYVIEDNICVTDLKGEKTYCRKHLFHKKIAMV
jgi:hypothetical protein